MIRKIAALCCVLFLTVQSPPAKALDTLDIIDATFDIDTLIDCQDYCVVDVCVSIVLASLRSFITTGIPGYFVFTPKIEHYNPDLVVSAYNLDVSGNSLNPWEWARVLDDAVARPTGNGILALLSTVTGGSGLGPGFGTSGHKDVHSQIISREAAVFGHPLASLPSLLEGFDPGSLPALPNILDSLPDATAMKDGIGGMVNGLAQSNAGSGDAITPAKEATLPAATDRDPHAQLTRAAGLGVKASGKINKYAGLASMLAPQYAGMIDGIAAVASVYSDAAAIVAEVQKVRDTVVKIGKFRDDILGAQDQFAAGIPGFEIAIDRVLCPSETMSFAPYYLSRLDAVGWHFGIPEMFYPSALIPGFDEIGDFPWYTWGSLYPRSGSLGSKDIDHAAAVFAQRAANITTQGGQPHVYVHASGPVANSFGTQINGKTKWQKLAPGTPETTCKVFGAPVSFDLTNLTADSAAMAATVNKEFADFPAGGVPIFSADTGNYSWTLWRHYSCCMSNSGTYLGVLSGGIGAVVGLVGLDALAAVRVCLSEVLKP